MRNLNFLRKSERKSVGTTLALTVGSPSAHRRYSALKHLAFMLLFLLGSLNVWGADVTCTLSNANIVAAGDAGNSYGTHAITDGCSQTWNAYAIKNKHSNATSTFHFLQIKKYASNTAYYLQVPEKSGYTIKSITMVVSGSNKPRTDGGNSTTLYFSASNSTSADGTGVASGTGASSVTIDCSSLELATGYITAGGAVRIWGDVVVTYTPTSSSCDKKVNISAGTTTNGTFDLSKTGEAATCDAAVEVTVTPHPAEHFEVDKVTASNDGSVSGPDVDGKYTVTYAQDYNNSSEINVTFKQKAQYTVTWNVNGETSTSQVYKDEKPVFPADPASCDAMSTTFVGWATENWTGKIENLDDKTVYTSAAEMPAVGAAVTYYAVFAKVAGESGWIETAISSLGASDIFVIVGNNGNTYAMTNNNGTSNPPSAPEVTIADSKITSEVAATMKWNISGDAENGYTFYPNGDSEKWLYCTNANNGVRVGTNADKTFVVDGGYLKHSGTSRYVGIYNSQDWRCYTSTDGTNIDGQTFAFYKYTAGSASDYMTTCCTKYAVNIAAGIEHGSISADLASACEGTTVTITFSPAGGYHLDSWSVNGTAQDVAASTFSMPAAAVEVSATFAHDDCENLAAPTLDAVTKNYNSATIAWNEVTDAEEYAVSVVNHATSASVFAGNVDALSKALADLEPETQYDYTIMAIGDGTVKCADGNGVLEGNFTTDALPTAVLTLMENGNEVAGGSHAITVPFALPTGVTHTCGKTFVGWTSKSDFADGDESLPSYYEKGADFTFENTDPVKLYAVYADEVPGTACYSLSNAVPANGDKVIIARLVTSTYYAMENAAGNSVATSELTVSTGVVSEPEDDVIWDVVAATTGVYLRPNGETGSSLHINSSALKVANGDTNGDLVFTANGNSSFKVARADNQRWIGTSGENGVTYTSSEASAAELYVFKYGAGASTYSNYSITCAAAPEVVIDPEEVNAPAAGVAAGVIEALYENVDEENISVALFNDAACTEAFTGEWLSASTNNDKNIAYTVAASDVYVARTAYIKLTAPQTTGATAPAVVVIPVSQEAKALVFASLEDLVAAELASGTEVTVSFSNILITEVYTTNAGYRYGLYLNVKDKDGENDIELFYNKQGDSEQVPDTWVKNGYVSATNLVTTWTEYKGQWELAMQGETWSWENGDITYGAPKAVSSVVVSGEPDKKAYVDGEKFNPAGLTVTVNYTIGDPEVIAVTDADWEFTPERLSIGETEISVKATYNTVQSAAFNVTGLTVGEIQPKTVQEFIAAGNADMRCYLEGTVSDIETGSKLKYGNFNLTDASGTIYVYGCLNQAGEAEHFADLDVHNGDKIKVIAEDYDYYNSKHEAKNVQFVSKVSPVQITIADKTLEVGQKWIIEATTDPAAAIDNISYSIKDDGSDAYVSLSLTDNEITAKAVGTATIIASIPAGEGYLANEIEFEVEVVEAGSIASVVILAKYDGQWYALMNEYYGSTTNSLNALAVDYNEAEGVLLDVAQPSAITWTRTIAAGKATFLNDTKYIAGGTGNTDLTLSESASKWTIDEDGHYMKGTRTFLYNDGGYFKNYNAGTNAGAAHYSDYPVVLANPQFANRAELRGGLMEGKWGTYCPDHDVKYVDGASFYTLTYKEEVAGQPYKVFFDEVEGSTLEGGKPYLFIADGEAIKGIKVGEDAVLHNYNGFTGVLSDKTLTVTAGESAAYQYYIIYGNEIRLCGAGQFNVPAERAYLDMSQMSSTPVAQAPGRRRISLVNHAAETATGIENAEANEAPRKVLINGELYIIRGEKMYDAKGQLVK